ncbi:spore coat protein H [Stigmatella aurantiaca]|uniref:Spore coat protein H n=1 Tax=Stigmatella aurantiaca TaxID=41 RepID=A0A1H7HLC9_STIAU|nr:spore coat protein H [Stigmatella aurantiaca]
MKHLRPLFFLLVALGAGCGDTGSGSTPPSVNPPPAAGAPDPGTPVTPPTSPPTSPGPLEPQEPQEPSEPQQPPAPPEVERRFELPPVQTALPEYELLIPPEAMAKFEADPWTPEQDAVFVSGGQRYNVKVRLRGASARFFVKKSWNVSFEKSAPFQGRTSLNLVAEFADATLLAEKISFDLLAAMRVPASKATFVRVKVNGVYQGPFLDIEQVNKAFLAAHDFSDGDASIYRCGWKDCEFKTVKVPYQGNWAKKTNEKEKDNALPEVLEVINYTPEPQFAATLAQHLEVEGFLRSMVLDALMSNNYVEDSESYFIHDRVTKRWVYVPWDLNNVDARWWYESTLDNRPLVNHPLFGFTLTDGWTQKMYDRRKNEPSYPGYLPVFSNLGTRVVMNPELNARLTARLRKALEEVFTPEVMNPYIDALHALVDDAMREDPYMDYAKFTAGKPFLRNFVVQRRQFILSELGRHSARKPTLVIEEFDPRAGVIVLGNRGPQAVSLAGKTLTTQLRVSLASLVTAPVGTVLPALTLAPGETRRFTASELGLTFPEKGEIGLFDGTSVVGVFDLMFYGPLPYGQRYLHGPNGWEAR